MPHRFDQLFNQVATSKDTPSAIVRKLSVEGGLFSESAKSFRKLNHKARISAVESWFKRTELSVKRPSPSHHECEICRDTTWLRGWDHEVVSRGSVYSFRKKYHWWCRKHFIQRMFNLELFVCTDACANRVRKQAGGLLFRPDNFEVWVGAAAVVTSKRPLCPHCGKQLRPK